MSGLIILNPGQSRPERMGGNARPLHAFPFIWADDVRVDGGARIRLVCEHCDRGMVLPHDVKWGTPSIPGGPRSLVTKFGQAFIRAHLRCDETRARRNLIQLSRQRFSRMPTGTVLTVPDFKLRPN